jgi:flagellar biosynthesis protein FlhB
MVEARTEEPTARRLGEARRRGEVASSPGLLGAVALLALLAALFWRGPALVAATTQLLRVSLQSAALAEPRASLELLADPLRALGSALWPLLLLPCLALWIAGAAQVGPLLAARAIVPAPERLDPRSRWQRVWSPDRLLEVSYAALAACVLLAILAWSLMRGVRALATLPAGDLSRAWSVLASLAADIVLRMGVAAMLLGTIDLVVRRVRARRALRMTRRELAAELRESYGAPEQRTRRERVQRELSALAALRDARMLLVDGAGRAIAVAVREAGGDAGAREPYLLAKGQGALALSLRARAGQFELPVRDHAPLVSALFRLEPGAAVPAEHDAALAALFVEASVQ